MTQSFNLKSLLNLNTLLIFGVLAVLLRVAGGGDVAIFAASALAIIPLAGLIGEATEEVAVRTGPQIGGLLNATLGNAAELIITIFALNEGLVELVRASIIGSILGNLLLVMGLAVLLGVAAIAATKLPATKPAEPAKAQKPAARRVFATAPCLRPPRAPPARRWTRRGSR